MYYLVEHPTRGVVSAIPGDRDDNYHFSWSGNYTDENKTRRFYIGAVARQHRDAVQAMVGDKHLIVIRRSDDWTAIFE